MGFGLRALLLALTTSVAVPVGAAAQAPPGQAFTVDETFEGDTLSAEWTLNDGYAAAFPDDTENHAAFTVGSGELTIAFPGGQEHNQWVFQHAEVHRAYGGSGTYEIELSSSFEPDQQFGLSFASGPRSFMQFMFYADPRVQAYVERFAEVDGQVHRSTVSGYNTGLVAPVDGPLNLRVSVDDDDDPALRTWIFEWSPDGASWTTLASGSYETGAPSENVGTIQTVGLFAGNQPASFPAFQASFEGFRSYPPPGDPPPDPVPPAPTGLSADPGDATVNLSWTAVAEADGYEVHRASEPDGPFTTIATTTEPTHLDDTVTNATTYQYRVVATAGTQTSEPSSTVSATPQATPPPPRPDPPAGIPTNGLALALDAANLTLTANEPVSTWLDSSTSHNDATATPGSAPSYQPDGLAGQPTVYFDGTNDHLSLPPGFEDFTAGVTVYLVTTPTTLTPGFKLLALGNGAGQDNVVLGRAGTTDGLQYFTTNTAGQYRWFNTAPALTVGQPHLITVTQPGGAPQDLVTATVTTNAETVATGTTHVPHITTRATNYLGRSYWNEGYLHGHIAEILLYNRTLTTEEHTTVTDYLTTKYALD